MVVEEDTTNLVDLGFWVLLRKSSRVNMGHMITSEVRSCKCASCFTICSRQPQ